jgi:hypothetical protein
MYRLLLTAALLLGALVPLAGGQAAPPPASTTELEARPAPLPPPSLWFEAGAVYRSDDAAGTLVPRLRVGVRGVQPLNETTAVYAAFALDGDLLLDLGGWYSFLPGADDLFGVRSYAGTGLSYVAGSFGASLSAALSYELSTQTSLLLVYTHRPLFLPALGQAFDVSFGVRITPSQ